MPDAEASFFARIAATPEDPGFDNVPGWNTVELLSDRLRESIDCAILPEHVQAVARKLCAFRCPHPHFHLTYYGLSVSWNTTLHVESCVPGRKDCRSSREMGLVVIEGGWSPS